MKNYISLLLCLCGYVIWAMPVTDRIMLILQCGSDWCESGEDVRKVFTSTEFKESLGDGFSFEIYDDMDNPSEKVKTQNVSLKSLRIESKRFPAITCLTKEPRRFFAQLENIAFDITAEEMAFEIKSAVKTLRKSEQLFALAKTEKDAAKAANAYGKGFALIVDQVGEFNEKQVREGSLAYKDEWKALCALDGKDRFGWRRRFEMGYGVDLVSKATKFRQDKDFSGGIKYIESLRRIPTNALTVVQRQAVDIAEYALWRKDDSKKESNQKILYQALNLGRDTLWGQCALGYLILSGEKFEKYSRPTANVLFRPAEKSPEIPSFPLPAIEERVYKLMEEDSFTENDKKTLVTYAVLRRIGKDGWNALHARGGSRKFIDAFFADRIWMEDFVWSGKCENWANALLALESIVYQDNKRWISFEDNAARRFATALALMHPDKSEALLADLTDAYRSTAKAKRLHKLAHVQKVWQWRVALMQTMGMSHPASVNKDFDYTSQLADQQRFLDKYVNMPLAKYEGTFRLVPWRNDNCFGEWVQRPFYYEPWCAADEWILRRYTPIIGGVCGELSKFGSACANAHGLPASPVGQPRHCALTRRLPGGKWEINYSVTSGTGFQCSLMPFSGTENFSYCEAHEGMFEGSRECRLNADRILELSVFAQTNGCSNEEVANLYERAIKSWHGHYAAWRFYGDWIIENEILIKKHKSFALDCAQKLTHWRQPKWDILGGYFNRVNRECGIDALTDELIEFMPLLRQNGEAIQEEGFFGQALANWTRPLEKNLSLKERVLVAAIKAQGGTKDYFSQVLSSSAKFMMADETHFDRFVSFIKDLLANDGKTSNDDVDLGKLLLEASQNKNKSAFKQLAQLQRLTTKLTDVDAIYPENDFGGILRSEDALLTTSSTSPWDHPRSYAFLMDRTGFKGNAFHTNNEMSPWAVLELSGPCRVQGVVVVNKTPCAYYRARQAPIEVQLSEDGKKWETVLVDTKVRDVYRVDLQKGSNKAQFVRVRRTPDTRKDVFHLNKILVYGTKHF